MGEALPQSEKPTTQPRHNRGWFRPGDRRINREGRPRGSSKVAMATGNCAPYADRLMLVAIPERDLAFRLTHPNAIWITNLPGDVEIVACRVNPAGTVLLTIRSRAFPRIAKGALIPRYGLQLNGKRWMPGR
jgi:hypothetical protein